MQCDHLRYFVARKRQPGFGRLGHRRRRSAGSGSRPMVRNWIKHLHNYVRSIDIYQHPHVIGEGPRSVAEGTDA